MCVLLPAQPEGGRSRKGEDCRKLQASPYGSLLTAPSTGSAIRLSFYVAFVCGGGSKEGLAPFGYLAMFRDAGAYSRNPVFHLLLSKAKTNPLRATNKNVQGDIINISLG